MVMIALGWLLGRVGPVQVHDMELQDVLPGRASATWRRARGWTPGRFLLGLDAESFEEGVDVVARGRPLLPEHTAAMVTETVANYDAHDRAVMTVAFVRYLRMMMAEVMVAFEQGVRADQARDRGEVLVEVPVDPAPEDEDGSSFMQRTLTGQFAAAQSPDQEWGLRLVELQEELGRQPSGVRNGNIAGLRARLHAHPGVPDEKRSSLTAMLVAMEDTECGETGIGDISWQMEKWDGLFRGVVHPALEPCDPAQVDTIPWLPDDAEVQEMAMEEDRLRREREREALERARQQEEHEREEEEVLQYQVGLLDQGSAQSSTDRPARLSAAAYRQWEDWEWFNVLNSPPQKRQRSMVQVTVSGAKNREGPWLSRALTIPMSPPGQFSIQLDFKTSVETFPDDVETVIVNPVSQEQVMESGAREQTEEMEGAADAPGPEAGGEQHPVGLLGETQVDSSSLHASQPGAVVESGMGNLEWKDYEELYEKWKTGAVSDGDVKEIGGGNLLDLMEAQFILDIDTKPSIAGTGTR